MQYLNFIDKAIVVFLFYFPALIAFVVGTMIGSFSNVIIHRLVYYKSIWSPPSHCTSCGIEIPGNQNIPLFSYLRLRGRCSSCGQTFSSRYFWVELLSGLLYVTVVFYVYTLNWPQGLGLSWREILTFHFTSGFPPTSFPELAGLYVMFKGFVFSSMLLILAMIDLEHQLLPWRISIPGMYFGLAIAVIAPTSAQLMFNFGIHWWAGPLDAVIQAFLGLLVGGGILFLIHKFLPAGMGGGDVVLLAMIGAFVGIRAIGSAMFLGFVIGGVIAVILMLLGKAKRKTLIPFGPFLALGGLLAFYVGEDLWCWYMNFYGS